MNHTINFIRTTAFALAVGVGLGACSKDEVSFQTLDADFKSSPYANEDGSCAPLNRVPHPLPKIGG